MDRGLTSRATSFGKAERALRQRCLTLISEPPAWHTRAAARRITILLVTTDRDTRGAPRHNRARLRSIAYDYARKIGQLGPAPVRSSITCSTLSAAVTRRGRRGGHQSARSPHAPPRNAYKSGDSDATAFRRRFIPY